MSVDAVERVEDNGTHVACSMRFLAHPEYWDHDRRGAAHRNLA